MSKKRRIRRKKTNHADTDKKNLFQRLPGLCRYAREGLFLGILVAGVVLIYSNTLQHPFIFDDLSNIKYNTHIRMTDLTWESLQKAGFESLSSNRPVANISFALNYYVHQYDVAGYHWTNILIHATAGIFLYLLVRAILSTPAIRDKYAAYKWIPLFTATIWLVHPIQTQSVTYLVQRMNSLSAMFYILSLLLYAKARLAGGKKSKWLLFSGCALAGILAVGSKEIAATLPFFIFLYEWYFHRDLSLGWLRRNILPIVALLAVFAVITSLFLGVHPLERILNSYAKRDFTLIQRVLTEFRVVVYYAGLLVFPHPSRLNLDHDFLISKSLLDPVTTLLALATLAGLVTSAVYLAKRQRLLSFCILWFLGNLVIESSVIGLEIAFEHRNYLPSMLVSLVAVVLIFQHIRIRWAAAGIVCAAGIVLSLWTYERNQVWRDEITLWSDCVQKSPQKPRPHNNLAVALIQQGKLDEAIAHYSEALRIKPDYAEAHFNLGVGLSRQGKFEEAVYHLSEMLRLKPEHAGAHNNLGTILHEQGKLNAAISHYNEALRVNPEYPRAHYNLGVALNSAGKTNEAINHYNEALRANPLHAKAHYNLGLALSRTGKPDEAVSHFFEALRIKPDDAAAHFSLGSVLQNQGKVDEAIGQYARVLKLKPDHAEAHNNLGALFYRQGRFKQAIFHYTEALRAKPDYAEAHNNLGVVLDDLGKLKEAVYHYREALRIKSDYADAHNNLGIALSVQGKLKNAVNHFREAVRIKPAFVEAQCNLGNAMANQGKFREAVAHYNEALRINPEDTQVRRNLNRALQRLGKSPAQ
jgi:tetratricopeptide (TPR) repeat protein